CSWLWDGRREVAKDTGIPALLDLDELLIGADLIGVHHLAVRTGVQHWTDRSQTVAPNFAVAHVEHDRAVIRRVGVVDIPQIQTDPRRGLRRRLRISRNTNQKPK